MAPGRHTHQQPGVCGGEVDGAWRHAFLAAHAARLEAGIVGCQLDPGTVAPLLHGCLKSFPLAVSVLHLLLSRSAHVMHGTHAPQYNTCFWALVKSGKTPTEAQATLRVGARCPPLPVPMPDRLTHLYPMCLRSC